MAHTETKDEGIYFNVMADGKFHQTVPEGTEGAVLREGELKDGTTFSKWEKLFSDISGKITKIEFYDGNYGKNLILTIEDEGYEPVKVSLNTSQNFGEDMLKKILAIDLEQPVKLVPYSLIDDKTKKSKKGITVYQNDEKIQSYFHSYDTETKVTTPLHGYPKAPVAKKGKTISADEWKLWFGQCRLFMINFIEDKLGLDNTADAEAAANKAFDGE